MVDEADQEGFGDGTREVLSHPVRRAIVETVRGNDGAGLRYLAIEVACREANRRGSSASAVGFDRMREEIETHHLPVLVDAGIVHYNDETEWVRTDGEAFDLHRP